LKSKYYLLWIAVSDYIDSFFNTLHCNGLRCCIFFFIVAYHGQPIGLILADTQRHAEVAAKLVKVNYDREGKTPVIGIKAAREQKSFWLTKETKSGPDPEPLLRADLHYINGNVGMMGQHHFYLETRMYIVLSPPLYCLDFIADFNNVQRVVHGVMQRLLMPYLKKMERLHYGQPIKVLIVFKRLRLQH
jgi:hypothetical protein